MDGAFSFQCSQCGESLQAENQQLGQEMKCLNCGETIVAHPGGLNYTCPNCSQQCSVAESVAGQNVTCPFCAKEFFATRPKSAASASESSKAASMLRPDLTVPEKLPFFKPGRRKLLDEKCDEMLASGGIDEDAEKELARFATAIGLDANDLEKIRQEKFLRELEPIKRQISATLMATDEDMDAVHRLEREHGIEVTIDGCFDLARWVYLIETKGQLPPPVTTDLMLAANESCYYSIDTIWHQSRVARHGYSGTSLSIPSGIKGVRFRFGGYTPITSEAITPLANGRLHVTSKRLLFSGDTRNTTVNLDKIVNCHIYSDALKIEKLTGKPDLFTMPPNSARYILALVGALK